MSTYLCLAISFTTTSSGTLYQPRPPGSSLIQPCSHLQFFPSYFHLVNSTPCSSPSSDSCLPPLLAPLQRCFVVAAVESASHTCEDCWPWRLGLAAAMINASTRQEASTSTCLANIYLLTHIIPVSGHTWWWTNLNLRLSSCCTCSLILPLSYHSQRCFQGVRNWKGGSFRFTHFFFLHLWMIKHAALGSSGRCTCWLPFDKAVTCTHFALRKKKRLCFFLVVKLKIPQGQMH